MDSQAGRSQILSEVTASLLAPEIDFLALKEATDRLFNLLLDITALDDNNDAHRDHLWLPSGKSLGAVWAAMCLNDLLRTKKFVRGLYQAIRAAQKKFPATRIHILYAGTGPFATLALPMTQVFGPEEIQFTFLEIQPESAAMLEKTIAAFQIEPFVHELVITDATQFRTNPAQPVHVLLSETMQHALNKEPQVAITMNLAPQLHPDGILVPERIDIWAGLLDPRRYMANKFLLEMGEEQDHVLLENVFSLDRDLSLGMPKDGLFPAREISLDPALYSRFSNFCLFTEILVFGSETIRKGESSLASPLILMDCLQLTPPPSKLAIQYEVNAEPGFRMRVVE